MRRRGRGDPCPNAGASPATDRDCHSADIPSTFLLKHLLNVEGGFCEIEARQNKKRGTHLGLEVATPAEEAHQYMQAADLLAITHSDSIPRP